MFSQKPALATFKSERQLIARIYIDIDGHAMKRQRLSRKPRETRINCPRRQRADMSHSGARKSRGRAIEFYRERSMRDLSIGRCVRMKKCSLIRDPVSFRIISVSWLSEFPYRCVRFCCFFRKCVVSMLFIGKVVRLVRERLFCFLWTGYFLILS